MQYKLFIDDSLIAIVPPPPHDNNFNNDALLTLTSKLKTDGKKGSTGLSNIWSRKLIILFKANKKLALKVDEWA